MITREMIKKVLKTELSLSRIMQVVWESVVKLEEYYVEYSCY